LDKRFLIKEIPITYRERPKGSFSKVNTIADGIKIVRTIFGVFQHYRPFAFFGTLSAVLFAIGAGLGIAPLMDSISGTEQGLGTIFTVLSIGVIILSFLFLNVGFILHSIVTLHRADYELELLRYRAQPSPIVLGSTAVNPAEAIRRAVG